MPSLIALAGFLMLSARAVLSSPVDKRVEPPGFRTGSAPYRVVPDGNQPGAANAIGTWLYGYTGCDSTNDKKKSNINQAYLDAWHMSNSPGVASGINWNEAAALEWLGAPGINKPQQEQIQALFANVATVIYSSKNPFQHYLQVRCDDPYKRCQNRADQDPCKPSPPQPAPKPKQTPNAYAKNVGPDNYPMINFCDGFFDKRSLDNAIAYGTAFKTADQFKLDNYDNQAKTFFHELTHLHLAADSPDPNPAVFDLTISVKLGASGKTSDFPAYGFVFPKILARYGRDVGKYVQQNADNLAGYALAKYVMTKNGNVYPHLPIVHYEIDGPPWYDPGNAKDSFLALGGTSANVQLNIEGGDDVTAFYNDFPEEANECEANVEDDTPPPPVVIDNVAPPSAYPDDYNNAVAGWLKDLGITQSAGGPAQPAPTPTPPANQPPKPRTCDVDCGSEIPSNGKPVCTCHCSDGKGFLIRPGSPPCV